MSSADWCLFIILKDPDASRGYLEPEHSAGIGYLPWNKDVPPEFTQTQYGIHTESAPLSAGFIYV